MPTLGRFTRLVLASASPRRRQILTDAGYTFYVREPGEVEERVPPQTTPENLARAKAQAKAAAVAQTLLKEGKGGANTLVLGADTLCALEGEILEKPLDRADATRILSRLSGTRHRVITGLCLWPLIGTPGVHHDTTWVVMRPLLPEEIAAYVASGEADGKAGAYAIQETGDRFVERLEGSVHNVAGFPLELFERLMRA